MFRRSTSREEIRSCIFLGASIYVQVQFKARLSSTRQGSTGYSYKASVFKDTTVSREVENTEFIWESAPKYTVTVRGESSEDVLQHLRLWTCFQILQDANMSGLELAGLNDKSTIPNQAVSLSGESGCVINNGVMKASAELLERLPHETFDLYSLDFNQSAKFLLISPTPTEGLSCDHLSKSINLEIARFAAWDSIVLRPSKIKVPGTISDGDTCEIAFPQGSASWEIVNGHWSAESNVNNLSVLTLISRRCLLLLRD